MRKVVCIGESILSPLGATPAENFAAVRRGESALRRYEGMFGVREPFVASLMDRSLWTFPGRTFFDSIVIEAARRAVEAAGIDPASPRTAFVLSSIKGNVEFIDTQDVTLACSARRLADAFGNPNPAVVVSNACISGLAALLQGRRMLLSGHYDHVVVVGAEVQSRFIVTGFQSLKALARFRRGWLGTRGRRRPQRREPYLRPVPDGRGELQGPPVCAPAYFSGRAGLRECPWDFHPIQRRDGSHCH